MTALQPTFPRDIVYDASYFDGKLTAYRHNAGYSTYRKSEMFSEQAKMCVEGLGLRGKKVLDVGCAKGFLVEHLVDLGVDAHGVDVSEYALNHCDLEGTDKAATLRRPDLIDRFSRLDATEGLKFMSDDAFDVVLSFRFLPCISDEAIPDLVEHLNRITKEFQAHAVDTFREENGFYNSKTPREWLDSFDWHCGTRIFENGALHRAEVK